MRRLSAVLVALLAATILAGLAPPANAAPVTYTPPVGGRVTDGFRPPETRYGRGNRGLTYETASGAPVRASAPGRVTFAGQVGGALHVVIQHADGVRTTYGFVRSVLVRVGSTVKQGDSVATAASSLHFGARIGDAYIDPAILLASGLARVHLVPDGEFSEPGADDDYRSLLSIVGDRLAGVSASALAWAQDVADDATRMAVEHLVTVLDMIVNLGEIAGAFATMAAALADILQSFIEACTKPEVEVPPVPERRIAVFVPGFGSSSTGRRDPGNLSKRLRSDRVYGDAQVYDFSYRGGRNPQPYSAKHTVRDIRESAADLRELLDQISRDHPGVPVDLIAHSQGGLVAREALAHRYDRPTRQLPPVAHLVTLGTPHHGADLATLRAWLAWSTEGRALLALGQAVGHVDLTGKSLAQLSETSDFIREINGRALRDGVAYTSIGAAEDPIVPAVRARLAGAANVLVDSGTIAGSHTGLVETDPARRELALAISDQPPTCHPIHTTAARAFTSAGIATSEDMAGEFLKALVAP